MGKVDCKYRFICQSEWLGLALLSRTDTGGNGATHNVSSNTYQNYHNYTVS